MATANNANNTTTATSPTSSSKERELAASKAAVSDAYEKLMEAKSHFKLAAEAAGVDLKHEAADQMEKGRAKAEVLSAQACAFMKEKPLATLGIAFAAGFVISQVCSRK
ncbi:MAG: hypothetical protein V7756_01755 [Halopseudomonas sp.]|uniref:hypothetical protein n=1 Tax=Halopseudomonas sp. TaxID=2901191 RepID=UPI003001194B